MRLLASYASCEVLIALDEADRCSALATHLQSSTTVATEYSLLVSSWKLGNVDVDGVERDWSGMMVSVSKWLRFFRLPRCETWRRNRAGSQTGETETGRALALPHGPPLGHVRKKTAFLGRGSVAPFHPGCDTRVCCYQTRWRIPGLQAWGKVLPLPRICCPHPNLLARPEELAAASGDAEASAAK